MVITLAGAVTGLAAAGRVGPFASLGGVTQHAAAAAIPGSPLRADGLFPAPTPRPPLHLVITVTDPRRGPAAHPPPGAAGVPDGESSASPPPSASASPLPQPSPSPRLRPCFDDCGGGGDGGGDN